MVPREVTTQDMTDQLWEAVKDLPEGTKIGNISFE